MNTEDLKKLIENEIPESDALVEDLTGEGRNFAIDVFSPFFEGKSVVKQHQLVYKALGDKVKNDMHAIKINTRTK